MSGSRVKLGIASVVGGLSLALGASVVSGHDAKIHIGKFYPTISYTNLEPVVTPPDPREPPRANPIDLVDYFSGRIITRGRDNTNFGGKYCGQAGRTVKVRAVGGPEIGRTKTFGSNGDWQLFAEDVPAGLYEAVLAKRKVKAFVHKRTGQKHFFYCETRVSPAISASP